MVDLATTLVPAAPGGRGGPVVVDQAPSPVSALDERILDAATALVARWGVTKTSLADVAKEAGCSRATLYRSFPGGKQQLFAAVGHRELAGYVDAIVEVVDEADDLADALTRGLVVAARLLRDHDAAQFVLAHEPELLLPFLGFKQVDRLYSHVSAVIGPHFELLWRRIPRQKLRNVPTAMVPEKHVGQRRAEIAHRDVSAPAKVLDFE